MTPADVTRLLKKYGDPSAPVPPEVRSDMLVLLQHAVQLDREVTRLSAEMKGAVQTMLAIVKQHGTVEVPYHVIDTLHDEDQLHITDLDKGEGQLVKQFSYVPFTPVVH